ncbi:MAG: hypothetical protein U0835_05580 [Isosphaeraceae bacterium]
MPLVQWTDPEHDDPRTRHDAAPPILRPRAHAEIVREILGKSLVHVVDGEARVEARGRGRARTSASTTWPGTPRRAGPRGPRSCSAPGVAYVL